MRIIRFFDKLEDAVRGWFSHKPILYGFIGGVGTVLFWRGAWHTADWISAVAFNGVDGSSTISAIDSGVFWDGLASLIIGSLMLLATGLLVSNFIGNEIIISGLRGEKKLAEKTEIEVKTETGAIGDMQEDLKEISARLRALEERIGARAVRKAPPKPPRVGRWRGA